MSTYTIINDDCLAAMREMPDNSVDAIVTDPPYGLEFMGKEWDRGVPSVEIWREAHRVLKPGGHILAFAGTRTQHRMCCAIEDAGFEIRDMLAWIYGSGFPKSRDVSKAIDDHFGIEREVLGSRRVRSPSAEQVTSGASNGGIQGGFDFKANQEITNPATPEAKEWAGWGTALKPALEPITLARKPFKGPVAANVLEWGTGALNVGGNRIGDEQVVRHNAPAGTFAGGEAGRGSSKEYTSSPGRWPANLIHDGSDEVLDLFPHSKGGAYPKKRGVSSVGFAGGQEGEPRKMGDDGSAARYFYCAKASRADREEGLGGFTSKTVNDGRETDIDNAYQRGKTQRLNTHPTVKPTSLMRHLCRLITPPGGLILDPFCGSGSTGKAAILEGFDFVGIDLSEEYCRIATARCDAVSVDPVFRLFEPDDLEA